MKTNEPKPNEKRDGATPVTSASASTTTTPAVSVSESYCVAFRGRYLQMIRAERARLEAALLGREVTDADAARSLIERASTMASGVVEAKTSVEESRAWTPDEIAAVIYERSVIEAEDNGSPYYCTALEVREALKIHDAVRGQVIAGAIERVAEMFPDAKVSCIGQKRHPCGMYDLWAIQAKPRPAARRAAHQSTETTPTPAAAPKADTKPAQPTKKAWTVEEIAAAVYGLAKTEMHLHGRPLIVSIDSVRDTLKIDERQSRRHIADAVSSLSTFFPGASSWLVSGSGHLRMWSVSPVPTNAEALARAIHRLAEQHTTPDGEYEIDEAYLRHELSIPSYVGSAVIHTAFSMIGSMFPGASATRLAFTWSVRPAPKTVASGAPASKPSASRGNPQAA